MRQGCPWKVSHAKGMSDSRYLDEAADKKPRGKCWNQRVLCGAFSGSCFGDRFWWGARIGKETLGAQNGNQNPAPKLEPNLSNLFSFLAQFW